MNPIRAALNNRQVVFVVTTLAVLLGLAALVAMPRREDPKITIRTGLVLARYPGATPLQVEQQVTRHIEDRLFRHAEVRKAKTFSTSRDGLVVVNVELEGSVKDPDRFWAMLRHDMNELHATELPPSVQGPVVNSSFGDVAAVLLSVQTTEHTPGQMHDYLDRIEDAIRTIPEVSRINRLGEDREELRVSTSNARLAGFGVTPAQVIGAVRGQNSVQDAGAVDAGAGSLVPIRGDGLLPTSEALSRLLITSSRDGRPVYLGDFARIERRVEDPSFLVRVDGQRSVILVVEMQEGHNIVKFGATLRETLRDVRRRLPADLVVEPIADQPTNVEHRMKDFGSEFLITLAAVLLVTVLLLPLRIAAIAAVAIPVTVAITVGILAFLGIELNQVTFAGLVVALGIVVDDAIVVADNYVEKLDHGESPRDAAWRAPTEMALPVLAATLTIVASFVPLAFLPGSSGEFMVSMSYTVTTALLVSFVVAMLLTPILALMFAKTGLHSGETRASAANSRFMRVRQFSPLEAMQSFYERAMRTAVSHKRLTLVSAVVAFIAGVGLLRTVPYRFFPMNERSQFVIDFWMPAGTRLAGTDAAMRRLETALRAEEGVKTVAAFVGAGAPRFYYSLNPEPPTQNYGQILVNTKSPAATARLVRQLQHKLDALVPDGWVYIKELQQGPVFAAPLEVRLVSDDVSALRAWGDTVARIFEHVPGSAYVHTDWRDDEFGLAIHSHHDAATRLGLTDADIAGQLAVGFEGAPISTFFEGKRDLDITLRLDAAERNAIDDVGSAYLVARNGARVPVRSVADVTPEWRSSRIVRRNGARTLTVRSFSMPDVLPSTILAGARLQIEKLRLPEGMRVELGGEVEGSAEVQGSVNISLSSSLLGVFLILVFQFRTVRHPLIVMVSIPLAVVGAALGLLLTHNPFTYTANLGLNALVGMVVRNAIILVDSAVELRAQGIPLEEAALLAGRRRLRPIFLTTMAAALGVTPMILSRSPLWSPMASVIAVGLIVSMVFTLIVVPILFVVVEGRRARRWNNVAMESSTSAHSVPSLRVAAMTISAMSVWVVVLASFRPSAVRAQTAADTARLSLDDAIARARSNGMAAQLARAGVRGAEAHERGVRAAYWPTVASTVNRLQSNGRTTIEIPQGILGNDGSGAPSPATNRQFEQGAAGVTYAQLVVTQPITQFYRIRQSAALAAAQVQAAAAGRDRADVDATLNVTKLYYATLIAQAKARAAIVIAESRKIADADAVNAANAGTDVRARALSARAATLEAEYAITAADNEAADLEARLGEAVGLAPGSPIVLQFQGSVGEPLLPMSDYVAQARASNPDIAMARAAAQQAERGIAMSRSEWIPDLGVGLTYTYQNGVAFLPNRVVSLAIKGSWTVLDFGKRSAALEERQADDQRATISLEHAQDETTIAVERAYRHAARAEHAAVAAQAALEAHRAAATVARDRTRQGITPVSYRVSAEADVAGSEVSALVAMADRQIARAELDHAVGRRK